jgi:hypothetical protein
MALNTQLDCYEFPTLALPYDRTTRDLDSTPRIVRGENVLSTLGGKNIKRPGTIAIANTALAKRVDRFWVYETLENPAKIYLLASAYDADTSLWTLYYNRLDGPDPGWTSCGSLRDCDKSTRPHEVSISRGLAFIKAFPASDSTEKYGTVIFDGTGSPGPAGLTFWGIPAPSVAARLGGVKSTLSTAVNNSTTTWTIPSDPGFPSAPFNLQCGEETVTVSNKSGAGPVTLTVVRGANGTTAVAHNSGAEVLYRDWSASALPVTVEIGWRYVYAWKTKTGQISCRSPLETNPDYRPSDTGAFTNKIPKIEVQGHADTTNVPKIVIYRTLDGGGTWYKLGEVNNTGAGAITVSDNFRTSLGGNLDPLPDSELDINRPAPGLDINQPPPPVILPQVSGTDTPQPCTKIVYYANRFWYAIGNILMFSGQEEIIEGIPEESWPLDNFYRFQHPIVNIDATGEAIYISSGKETFWIRGSNRETFQVNKLFGEIGGILSNRSSRAIGNTYSWITQDYRVASARVSDIRLLSAPLFDDIVTRLGSATELDLGYFAELDKEYLVINLVDKTTPANSRQWIYDIGLSTPEQPFWNPPWTISNTAMLSDRIRESDTRRYMCFWMWDGENGHLAKWDAREQTVQDAMPSGATNYSHYVTFNLIPNPAGNHVNLLRRPGLHTPIHAVGLDRTLYTGDVDATVEYYLDDLYTTPLSPKSMTDPSRRSPSIGYQTKIYQINQVGQRIAVKVSKDAVNERFELQGLTILFRPNDGA